MKNIDDKDLVDVSGGGRPGPGMQSSVDTDTGTGGSSGDETQDNTTGDDQGGQQHFN